MGETRRKLTRIEKVIGENLRKSVTSFAQTSGSGKVNYDKLLALKDKFKAEGKRISMTAFYVKAVAGAMKASPEMNARLEGENLDELVIYDSVNVGVGIDTPKGLVVAVVKDAQDKTLFEIADTLNDLVDRARANKLGIEDVTGSTVTISNLYNTNTVHFNSVINNNETLLLGFAGIYKEVIVGENDEIKIAHMGNMVCNLNHTATSGWPAGIATDYIVNALENPEEYLL